MNAANREEAGVRELLLLGLLRQREMHGYQLSEFLDTHLGLFFEIKKATAYNLLQKMEERGWVEARKEQEGNRPPRRVFTITAAGEAVFQEVLRTSLAKFEPAVFPGNVPVLFLSALTVRERRSLLEKRMKEISAHLSALGAHMEHGDHPLLDHQKKILEAERDWTQTLLEEGKAE